MNDGHTTANDKVLESLSSENGRILSKMDFTMAQNVDIKPQSDGSADPISSSIRTIHQIRLEDEESNQSSSSGERSDRSSTSPTSKQGRWKIDINGNLRYGSSDSATSTTMSSVCSSIPADDKLSGHSQLMSTSRKRMSDGSLKPPSLRLYSSSSQLPQEAPEQTQPDSQAQQTPPKKRRGRPPKDKSLQAEPTPRRTASRISKLQDEARPRSSIPSRLPVDVYAAQCIEAAYAARLDPFALHPGEHARLVDLLMSKEVTVYLNIRNAILRLWTQNPLCCVTPQEAAGCAKESRFFGLTEAAYKWLARNGYINFGCIEAPREKNSVRTRRGGKPKTVVVIGAGVSGLTTARQLENLFAQDSAKWIEKGEQAPRVIVLEGRKAGRRQSIL